MLTGSGIKTADKLFVHGFLTVNGEKMSKSRGTFIKASTYAKHLNTECLRYYYASKLTDGIDDIDLKFEDFINKINSDLVGKFANLASRSGPMLTKKLDSQLGRLDARGKELISKLTTAKNQIIEDYENLRFASVVRSITALADEANRYVEQNRPWVTIKTDPEQTRTTLTATVNAVAILNALSILNIHFKRKPLLFLIDEFENAMHISGDARVSFTEAMRSLVDEGSQASVIFALTARALAEMPSSISDEPVKRRIGLTNYVMFREYNESELEQFVHQVIDYRRDKQFNVKNALSSLKSAETVTEKTYPFSQDAIEEIVKSVVLFKEQGRIEAVRPKEALEIMDKALRVATAEKLLSINKDLILGVRDQVVEALRL